MVPVAIGLGSNLGDSAANLLCAMDYLGAHIYEVKVSSTYRTAPMYVTDQPEFLNAVCVGFTLLGPLSLVAKLKEIEQIIGRVPKARYGPREIDLDLLAFGSLHLISQGTLYPIEVPHSGMPERNFVLTPFAEVSPNFYLPGHGTVSELLTKGETSSAENDVQKVY